MKTYTMANVDLTGGYLFEKQELNRSTTIRAVYDRFEETGRIGAFRFNYRNGDPNQPHFFWDSDVAKWIEGAAYILQKNADPELEKKVDDIVELICENQHPDGYFNIYFTVIAPADRFRNRDWHELYCAGHLMEAAVAYAEATGKTAFLAAMERYADYIYQVFVVEKSANFVTPGHEELELALVRMYRHTGKRKYLDLAAHFINCRGVAEEMNKDEYNQSHLPVRQQQEALGHAVRAVYLYTAMVYLAAELKDESLANACRTLYEDMVKRKMYVTGGLGSSCLGEAFTSAFDLPNDQAYSETCAGIGMLFFTNGMLALENNAGYADTIEQVLYNGLLSGLSLSGDAFFYENPLEITLSERFKNRFGERRFPITQRRKCFDCSCCPPNINRLLASLGSYLYGIDGSTLYVNQFASSDLSDGDIRCSVRTDYPRNGEVAIQAVGVEKLAVRIPGWCRSFSISKPYTMENGYAVIDNDGCEVKVSFDMTPQAIFADPRVIRDAGRLCIRRGPVVYCAESVDNGENLHSIFVSPDFTYTLIEDNQMGLPRMDVSCKRRLPYDDQLYSCRAPISRPDTLHLIPYNAFANRGESDMLVWLNAAFE